MLGMAENIFRWFFSWIDRAVILMLNAVYNLLMKLATLNIVNMDTIKTFSTRIGLILGIFMLFNLAVNMLSYLVSPEKFSDSKQGGMKIFWNVIVSVVLLGTINIIFENAYKLQYAVLEKQIIPQIIFGTKSQDPTEKVEISYYVFSSMINVNPAYDMDGLCETIYLTGDISKECRDLLKESLGEEYYQFERAVQHKDASKLLTADNITAKSGDEFVFDYLFVFSTIIGVITTLIMFNFCFDIAKRSVKLYFYQLIAPIPIIANMIPGKGSDTFKKWFKSVVSTYVDIFIRLVAIFFAIFLISTVYSSMGDIFSQHKILGIFILLGSLMFAKEIPQLIQDLTGLKLDGGFTINPIKKLNQVPVMGKGFGAIGGAIAGARAGGRVGNTLGGALTGAFMGASSIPLGGSKDGKLALSSATNDVYKRMTGSEFINFSLIKAPLRMGAKARIDEIKAARNVATDQLNSYNSQLNVSESMTSNIANELAKKGLNINDLATERARLQQLQNRGNDVSVDAYNEANAKIQEMEAKREQLKEAINGYASEMPELKNDLMNDLKKLEENMSQAEAIKKRYEDNVNMLHNAENTLSMIDKYENGIDEQNELRKRISNVQKDIDDLNNEKRQRERFYDYDPSPQSDIKTLVGNTREKVDRETGRTMTAAENYESRIDEKIHPKQ